MRKLMALLCLLILLQPAHAAIVSSGASTYATQGNTENSFTLNRPASVNVDDLLLVQINFGSSSITVSTPSGWTLLRNDTNGSDRQYLFYRVATAQDTAGGATSWTLSGNIRIAATMTGLRSDLGARTATPGASSVNTGSGTAMTAASVTAGSAGALLRFYGNNSGNVAFTVPGALTQYAAASTVSAANGASALAAGRSIAAAGASGSDVVTASRSASWIAQSLLLIESQPAKPASCFNDDFSNTTSFGQNWVTTTVGTTAFTPAIAAGRLRLTSNNGYISTAATLQRLFPTSNLIYVEFNYYSYPNASGADGVAVTLSDASITPQPGGFGGSLGYAQRSGIVGFAGGWLGVALDEYGNYSNPTEGRNGGPGFRVDSVAVRGSGSGQTGYAYVAGTAANIVDGVDSSSTPGPGHRYRIVIDAAAPGQTYVTVDRDTAGGSNYTNLVPTFNIAASAGQAAIPTNLMLSLTGSTGGSSNIHEIGSLSVCATTINTAVQVDHFEIQHDSQGLTCEPENVTIRTCANADCSTLMAVPVSVTLSPAAGWVGGNVQTINGSATLQYRQLTAATVPIVISNSTPGQKPFTTNRCNGTSTNTCNLPFANTGLAFDVPNLLANKPSGSVRLRAVRTDTQTGACTSLIPAGSTRNINFGFNYTDPGSTNAGDPRVVEIRSVNPAGSFVNTTTATTTAVPLLFQVDAFNQVFANFEARYTDAGLMLLNASYSDGTVTLNGTDSFVSSPAGFCVYSPDSSTASGRRATCSSPHQSCNILTAAGNPFALTISARQWQSDTDADVCTGNGTTPNYVQNGLVLSSQVVEPDTTNDGGVNGIITPATVNITANGSVALTNATESEVGAFTFTVTPPPNAYTPLGVTVPPGTSTTLGRFTPHHFTIAGGSSLRNRATSCAPPAPAFTYLNEPLQLTYQIDALNANNVLTQNYRGVFAHLTTFDQMHTAALASAPARTALAVASAATPANPFSVTWLNGQGTVESPVSVAKALTPSGPFTNTAFGVAPIDADGVATTGFNLDTTAVADAIFDRVQIGSATELRYGRLRLNSVTGPVDSALPLPITAEYWNGSAFVPNTLDTNCTTIASALGTLGPYRGALNSGDTALNGSATLITGRSNGLSLSAPGAGNEGSVDVTLDLSAFPWLQFDWDGSGAFDTGVTGTGSFGLYRGSDRVIYWQER